MECFEFKDNSIFEIECPIIWNEDTAGVYDAPSILKVVGFSSAPCFHIGDKEDPLLEIYEKMIPIPDQEGVDEFLFCAILNFGYKFDPVFLRSVRSVYGFLDHMSISFNLTLNSKTYDLLVRREL